jgi:hypothetical protein
MSGYQAVPVIAHSAPDIASCIEAGEECLSANIILVGSCTAEHGKKQPWRRAMIVVASAVMLAALVVLMLQTDMHTLPAYASARLRSLLTSTETLAVEQLNERSTESEFERSMTEDNFERWITAGDDLGGDGWGWVTAGIALDKEFLPQEVAASMNFSVNPCDNFYGEAI